MEKPTGADEVRSLQLPGGRMAYWERGSGRPMVLVHGLFGDHQDWAPVLGPLAERQRVIAIDLPGFGQSEQRPAAQYSLEFYSAQLEALFAAMELREVTLVGNSLGGLISGFYAAAHPERLRGLALVSAAGMRTYSAEEQAFAAERFSAASLAALRPEYIEPLFSLNFAQRTPQREAYLEHQRSKLAWPDYAAYCEVLAACAKFAFAHPLAPALQAMELPVLLLWGDSDVVFPVELARAALPGLKHGRLALVEGASHMPQMDNPADTMVALEGFAESAAVSAAELRPMEPPVESA
jgi:pimeloyl-ACP methyl ester carboxylesterase